MLYLDFWTPHLISFINLSVKKNFFKWSLSCLKAYSYRNGQWATCFLKSEYTKNTVKRLKNMKVMWKRHEEEEGGM